MHTIMYLKGSFLIFQLINWNGPFLLIWHIKFLTINAARYTFIKWFNLRKFLQCFVIIVQLNLEFIIGFLYIKKNNLRQLLDFLTFVEGYDYFIWWSFRKSTSKDLINSTNKYYNSRIKVCIMTIGIHIWTKAEIAIFHSIKKLLCPQYMLM